MINLYEIHVPELGIELENVINLSSSEFAKSVLNDKFWIKSLTNNHFSDPFITKTCLFKYVEKFSPPKTENFQIKISDIFHISAQNIDCGYTLEPPRRGGSKEYPQSMFLSRDKNNKVYPCKPQFYYIKVGFEGVKII